MSIKEKKCVPCEGRVPRLTDEQAAELHQQIPSWELREFEITKSFRFKNFVEAMKFVNRMADLAEQEGHHPDFGVHYDRVDITIWTHAIGGLSENDFILAAKIDDLR